MEALDATSRKSGLFAIINRDQDRTATIRPYTSSMSATVASPTSMSMFSNGPPPPYSGWSGPPAHLSFGLNSPPDSRRTSDNKPELPPLIRTSTSERLPSILEAINNVAPKPSPYHSSPPSATLPPSHQQQSYPTQPPSNPRTYSTADPYPPQLAPSQPRRGSPPQPLRSRPQSYSHSESLPHSYSEGRHGSTSLQSAPGPPSNPYAPRFDPLRYEQDPRAPERGHTHHAPSIQQPSHQYGPPPDHMPSTRPRANTYSQPQYPPRDGREPDNWKLREGYASEQQQQKFSTGLKRHLDVWDFENNLAQINTASSALLDWSAHYNAIAQEQQRGANMIPDRMPSLDNCKDMLMNGERIIGAISRMKEMVEQHELHLMDQRMREHGGKGVEYEEDNMYGEDMTKSFGGSDGKKQRRGRAAPPGRCHSCNRAETPEWRRGPDGARTLCNACGLHYAKLTRKQTMKQSQGSIGSSLRPKSMDVNAPRPM